MGVTNGEEMDAYFFEHPGLNEHAAIGEQPHILVIPADKRTKKIDLCIVLVLILLHHTRLDCTAVVQT